jgi:hypothetical protein
MSALRAHFRKLLFNPIKLSKQYAATECKRSILSVSPKLGRTDRNADASSLNRSALKLS